MANIAVFLPRQTILEYAQKVIAEDRIDVQILKVVDNASAVPEAQAAIEAGVQIIVARGLQATLIKKHTSVPVVEMPMTTQEIGLMILKAKRQLKKEHPRIAIVGFENMFTCMEHLEELFDFDLSLYLLNELEETRTRINEAIAGGADLIIGGVKANQVAFEIGFPCLFVETREDSIREALGIACRMGEALDMERHSDAQLETILDTAFNGIIKINAYKEVVAVNHMIENLLGKTGEELIGFPVDKIMPGIDAAGIDRMFDSSSEMYSQTFWINRQLVMLIGALIQYDGSYSGAILTCHKVRGPERPEAEQRKEAINAYPAQGDFHHFLRQNEEISRCISLARRYAMTMSPVLIYGETGTEKELIAESIHNNGMLKGGPFLNINCSTLSSQQQLETIFGIGIPDEKRGRKKSAMENGQYGTILLQEIDHLCPEAQYLLYKAINNRTFWINGSMVKRTFAVRIIATAEEELSAAVKAGNFRNDLYYLIQPLNLRLPSLREYPEEIPQLIDCYLERYNNSYTSRITVSADGKRVMQEYQWEGNLLQLERFCERLVLTANRKRLEEGYIRELLLDTYPLIKSGGEKSTKVVVSHPEALHIMELMEACEGNRIQVAEQLGISTTTLWRRMKKYGIGSKYGL